MKKIFKLFCIFISCVFAIGTLGISVFADVQTDYTDNNSTLGGNPYFSNVCTEGQLQSYVRSNLANSTTYCIHIYAVAYYNGKIYIPCHDRTPYQITFYFYQGEYFVNGAWGLSTIHNSGAFQSDITTNNSLVNANCLYSYVDNSVQPSVFRIKYLMPYKALDDGGYKYIRLTQNDEVTQFAHFDTDTGEILYTGISLGGISPDDIYYVVEKRPYSDKSLTYNVSEMLLSFNDDGIVDNSPPMAAESVFPRYISTASDRTGFYYDDLKSNKISFYVKDNRNHHSYGLVVNTCHFLSNRADYTSGATFNNVSYTWVNDDYISSYNATDNDKNALAKWQNNNLIFSPTFTIDLPCLDFTDDNAPAAISASFHLSSFMSFTQSQLFRFDVVDKTTGSVIHSVAVMCASSDGYKPTTIPVNSGSWSDTRFDSTLVTGAEFNEFSYNNTPYFNGINTSAGAQTGTLSSQSNLALQEYTTTNGGFNYNVNISDLNTAFSSSIDSARSFFTLCIGLIPSSILALVIGALGLVIVLRILGR